MAVHVVLSNTSGEPIYAQIRDQIAQQILEGSLSEGEALPSIRGLARDLSVSVITTTRAYSELAAAGLIANVQGKGSYVLARDEQKIAGQMTAQINEALASAVHDAKLIGMPLQQLQQMLEEEYEH